MSKLIASDLSDVIMISPGVELINCHGNHVVGYCFVSFLFCAIAEIV